jgi:hypothetical protein
LVSKARNGTTEPGAEGVADCVALWNEKLPTEYVPADKETGMR